MAIMKSCLLDRLGLGGGVDLYSGTPPRGQGEVREAGRAKGHVVGVLLSLQPLHRAFRTSVWSPIREFP